MGCPLLYLGVQVAPANINAPASLLRNPQKPFKYVCHVSLTQRCGAGVHAASCQRWNQKTDGGCNETPAAMPRRRMQLSPAALLQLSRLTH